MTVDVYRAVPVEAPYRRQFRAAIDDLSASWRERQIWIILALKAVAGRYRRTILGPWWITLMTLIFIFGLSYLRIGLTGVSLESALPYVGLGFIAFGLISGGVMAGANVFSSAGSALASSQRPTSSHVLQSNAAQVLDFLHDSVAILVLAVVFGIAFTPLWGLSAIAAALIVASGVGIGLWLGPIVARFRDLAPIVQVTMRLMFFVTPIFWSIDEIQDSTARFWLTWWNPFTYQMLAFRDPILGTSHGYLPLLVTAGIAVANLAVGLLVFAWARPRLPYWVTS